MLWLWRRVPSHAISIDHIGHEILHDDFRQGTDLPLHICILGQETVDSTAMPPQSASGLSTIVNDHRTFVRKL